MTDLILPRLPKSMQYLWIEYGRHVMLGLVGAVALVLFIVMYETNADKVTRTAFLEITAIDQGVGANRSAETTYTVTTPEGGSAQFATQSPAIIRDAQGQICAEELTASDGSTRWEASPISACQ